MIWFPSPTPPPDLFNAFPIPSVAVVAGIVCCVLGFVFSVMGLDGLDGFALVLGPGLSVFVDNVVGVALVLGLRGFGGAVWRSVS